MSQRFTVIDAVRGFCLLNIFINHLNLSILRELSISKLGMSDTAEVFVFLAGVSVFFHADRDWGTSLGRILRRAIELYGANLCIIVATITVLFLADALNGEADILNASTADILERRGTAEILGSMLTFSQSYGYSMVLRLYVFLMLWAPFALWLARRRFWYPLLPAVIVWACAGHFDLVVRNQFTNDPFALTLLPWTLVFTCGISFAAGLSQGASLPRSRILIGMATAYVTSYVVIVAVDPQWPAVQGWFDTRNDHFWLGGSKTYQSPARVLHLLCCVYLFVLGRDLPVIRLFYQVGERNILCRLGRASLAVFAVGAVAAVLIDEIVYIVALQFGLRSAVAIATELGLVMLGCAAMLVIAERRRDRSDGRRSPQPVLTPASVKVPRIV
jgi:hypothetical protein